MPDRVFNSDQKIDKLNLKLVPKLQRILHNHSLEIFNKMQ
ncbi:hypothetical protein LEP1GSC013_3488 [Leptospira interrogans serovar Valbuzzi str. Duyster]|nr:hypothetical protein LEP1GSC013_3488 [Leptospira interrogans serovar Valbuzzi str. Duyster]ENO71546.1 hypothetical protein LEP1GSC012_0223 [Leptospira interrogans serovar Valbuzzi str. Valbuzzi]